MNTFYIVRHGETLFNHKGLIQGWSDSPLTQLGYIQCLALSKGLSKLNFDACYCGYTQRTLSSAQIILQNKSVKIIPSMDLNEISYGTLEGDLKKEAFKDKNIDDFTMYQGESISMVKQRLFKVFDHLNQISSNHCYLLILSSGIISILIDTIDPNFFDTISHPSIDNCSVSIIQYANNTYSIQSFNDLSYLEKGINQLEL